MPTLKNGQPLNPMPSPSPSHSPLPKYSQSFATDRTAHRKNQTDTALYALDALIFFLVFTALVITLPTTF